MVYSRERATKGKQLTLKEIIGFLNRIEQNVGEAALTNVVSMPRGGNLLDSIQSGGQTINTFNTVDADTITGVFASSFHTHHRNRQQESKFSYKNKNGYNNADKNTRFIRRSNYGAFPSNPRGRGRNNGSRVQQVGSYRQPMQKGSFPSRQRGQQFQTRRGNPMVAARPRQQSYYPANERRARSPGPRISRSPINNGDKRDKRGENLPRSRSNSQGKSKTGCLRCGRVSHLASFCPVYQEYSDTHCKRCNLLHKTSACRQAEAQVHLGEIQMDLDVPVVLDARDHVEELEHGQEV